jgi:hypothetical protein
MKCPFVPPDFWKTASSDSKASLRARHGAPAVEFMPRSAARVVAISGDGNCLFGACSQALAQSGRPDLGADNLRRLVVDHISTSPDDIINGWTIEQWLHFDRGITPAEYGQQMDAYSAWSSQTWGGALEETVIASLVDCRISVWEQVEGGLVESFLFEYVWLLIENY